MISYPLRAGPVLTRVLQAGAGDPVVFVHGTGGRADRFTWLRAFADMEDRIVQHRHGGIGGNASQQTLDEKLEARRSASAGLTSSST